MGWMSSSAIEQRGARLAAVLLRLFGLQPDADGDYVLSEEQELRLLHTIGRRRAWAASMSPMIPSARSGG
jgi:hypothetical protein